MSIKQYHIIYQIINIRTNEYYIGVHSTDNVNDGYLGSGQRIKAAIKKYGKETFVKQIMSYFPTREEAILEEAKLVNIQVLSDPKCLNLIAGGKTTSRDPSDTTRQRQSVARRGWSPSDETRQKMSMAKLGQPSKRKGTKQIKIGKPHSPETKQKISESSKNRPPISDETRRKLSEARRNRVQPKHSEESKRKMSEIKRKKHLTS